MKGIIRHRKSIEIRPQRDSVWICDCGSSRNAPFCDGSHEHCSGSAEGKIYKYVEGKRVELGTAPEASQGLQPVSVGTAKSEILVLPSDANHYGNIFGGTLLSLMDRTSFIAASKYANNDVVTVAIENVVFKAPIKIGETAAITAHISHVGRTSIEVCVNVVCGKKNVIESAFFTFVSVNAEGKPIPVPRPSFASQEEEAGFRLRAKERLT